MDTELIYRYAVNATKSLGSPITTSPDGKRIRLSRSARILVAVLIHHGMGKTEIAKRLGVSQSLISHTMDPHRIQLIKSDTYKADYELTLERTNSLIAQTEAQIAQWGNPLLSIRM